MLDQFWYGVEYVDPAYGQRVVFAGIDQTKWYPRK